MMLVLVAAVAVGATAHAQEKEQLVYPNDEARRWAETALTLHKQAAEGHEAGKTEEAHGYYQRYLAKYAANADTLAYYDGELLFSAKRFDEAATAYDRSLTAAPAGPHAAKAAYAFVVATKNAVEQGAASAECPGVRPCPIAPAQQRMLAAYDRYLHVLPGGEQAPAMEYRRARVYYQFNQFETAAPLFDAIVARYPDNELAVYSANLEMDCFATLRRFGDLRAAIRRIKESPVLRDATVRGQVEQLEAKLKKLP
jgi:tetratricopeptide (TPR) repeat protein